MIAIINSIYGKAAPNFKLYKNKRLSPTADYNFIKGGLIFKLNILQQNMENITLDLIAFHTVE